jgi:anti-anti-sigma factor
MTEATFAIDRDVDPRAAAVRLRLTGTFDRAALPALQRAVIGEATRPHTRDVVVDVAAMTVIDQPAVEVLLRGYTAALRGGRGFRVINAGHRVHSVLSPAGLCAEADDSENRRLGRRTDNGAAHDGEITAVTPGGDGDARRAAGGGRRPRRR